MRFHCICLSGCQGLNHQSCYKECHRCLFAVQFCIRYTQDPWCRILYITKSLPLIPNIYVSIKINEPTLVRIQSCVKELKSWVNHHRLHTNNNTTPALLVITPPMCSEAKYSGLICSICIYIIYSQDTVIDNIIAIVYECEMCAV